MRARRIAALCLIGLAVLAGIAMRGLEIDNRLERWVGDDQEQNHRYRQFLDVFGSDEFLVAAISGAPLFDPETLELMLPVVVELEAVPGVVGVEGLPVVYRELFGGEDPEELEVEATSTPFYRNLFLSEDAQVAGLLIEVEPQDGAASRHAIVRGVRRALDQLTAHGLRVELVGSTVLSVALDELSLSEARRSFPLAFVLSMSLLALLLRSLRGMLVAATSSTLTVVLTLGLMAVVGRPLNMVTSALPSLLWVLALANCIHILQRYQRHRPTMETDPALVAALAETTRPCILATVTTALGFLSLMATTMEPVRELGLFAAIGILSSLAVNLFVTPTVVSWLRLPARRPAGSGWWSAHQPRRPLMILVLTSLLVVAALAALPWVPVESNPLSFLPEGHATSRSYRWVGERLTGFYSMEVVIELPQPWWAPESWPVVDALADRIAASPAVARLLTPLDLLRKLNQWDQGFDPAAYALPASHGRATALLERLDGAGRERLERLVGDDGATIRLSAIVDEMSELRFLELVQDTRRAVGELPAGYGGWVTGMVLRLVTAQQQLIASQLRSLALACLVVFMAIGIGLRSWRLTVVSMLPNVLPVVAVFGLMAALRIPLDAATVMVAAVALGIAVDNTVHLLTAYQRERESRTDAPAAVGAALDRVGSALIVTTATACIGFFSLCLSAFVPIRDFGLLAGSAMLVALAADLLVVPAILVIREATR